MEEFILHSSKLSLPTFLSSFSYLKKIQLINGWFTFDDLCEALNSSPDLSKLSPLEINFYSMLFLESCCLGIKSTVSFSMPEEILANEKLFLKNLLSRIETKIQGNSNPLIEEFINEVTDYLNGTYIPSVKPSLSSYESFHHSPQLSSNNSKSNAQSPVAKALNTSSSDTSSTNSISDKQDPMTVFLAHLRKNNMDILFPRGIHDKILACIYVVMSMGYYSFHKDIIEDVMILKSSLILSEISDISKTKIRGVISLLKYSSIIVVDDTKSRLIFASGIDSFQELRSRHDAYINRFILDNQITIPSHLKSELVWQFDDIVKQQRIDIITQMIQKLENYLQEYFLKTKNNNNNKETTAIISNQSINSSHSIPNINNNNMNINNINNNILTNNNSNYYSQGVMRNNTMNQSNVYHSNTHNNYNNNNNYYHMNNNNNNNNYQNNHINNNKQTYSNPSQISQLQYASSRSNQHTNNNHTNLMDNHSRRMFSQQRYPNPRHDMNSSYSVPPPPGIIGFAESKEKTPPTKYRPHNYFQTESSNFSSSFHGITSSFNTSSTDFFYNGFDGLFQTTSPQINNNNNLKSIII